MAKVIKDFRDRVTWKLYSAGDEYTGKRQPELKKLGFIDTENEAPKRRATRKTVAK